MNPQSPFRFMQAIMLMAGVYFLFSGISSVMKGGLTLPGGLLLVIAAAFFGLFAFDYHVEKKKLEKNRAANDAAMATEQDETTQSATSPADGDA